MPKFEIPTWKCLLEGKINIPGGVARTKRWFDGGGDLKASAREALKKRKDGGSPWYGDIVTVTTPLGQRIEVMIHWPGEEQSE